MLEPNMIYTRITFWFAIDSRINTALLFATTKTTCANKICRKEESSFEWNILWKVKNNAIYSIIIAKHTHGKVWNCFHLFFYRREIHYYFMNFFKVSGRSIEEILIGLLAHFFDSFFDSLSNSKYISAKTMFIDMRA